MACNSYIWYPYLTLTIIVRLDGHKISYSVAYAVSYTGRARFIGNKIIWLKAGDDLGLNCRPNEQRPLAVGAESAEICQYKNGTTVRSMSAVACQTSYKMFIRQNGFPDSSWGMRASSHKNHNSWLFSHCSDKSLPTQLELLTLLADTRWLWRAGSAYHLAQPTRLATCSLRQYHWNLKKGVNFNKEKTNAEVPPGWGQALVLQFCVST